MTKYSIEYLDKDFYMWSGCGRGSKDNLSDAMAFFEEIRKEYPHHIVRLVSVLMESEPQSSKEKVNVSEHA